MARVIVLIWFAMAMLGTRTAEATGRCESTPRTYAPPRLFSEQALAFASFATQAWCEERGPGGEVRGVVAFVELRDLDGGVVGILSSARGRDARRLEQAVGAFEAIAADRLAATLKARGYAPLVVAATRGKTRCEVRTASIRAPKETVNGFPAERVQVDVVGGTGRILRVDADLIAQQRRDKLVLRAHVLTGRAAIAVWLRLPSCAGPPPGYFGPDDLGDCYPDDEIKILRFDAANTPALAACFAPP
jgi:hypothetical protein